MYYNEKACSLWGSTLLKKHITLKKASNKNCSDLNFVKKSLRAHMSMSRTSGARGSKDQYVWNIIMYRNGKLDSLWGSMLPKICIISKNPSNTRGARYCGQKESGACRDFISDWNRKQFLLVVHANLASALNPLPSTPPALLYTSQIK